MKVDGCSVARLSLEQSYVSMDAVKPGKGTSARRGLSCKAIVCDDAST